MKLSEQHAFTTPSPDEDKDIWVVPLEIVAQLEAEIERLEDNEDALADVQVAIMDESAALKRVTTGMDVHGLRAVAAELARFETPYIFPLLWRDTGLRQRQIGEQLLRLVDALLKERE